MTTKAEFEHGYAERSGMTIERLRHYGLRAKPCDCGDKICKGWQMDWTGMESGRVDFLRRPAETVEAS